MKLALSDFMIDCMEDVRSELRSKGLNYLPKYYITDVWGCPTRVPVIGIPYSYCAPVFNVFEEDRVFPNKQVVLKILRHEIGHCINYAFKLYDQLSWTEYFGEFRKPYRLTGFNPDAGSKDFVKHLMDYGGCYAQLHPDEDFAETFAVWLGERENWESLYKGWGVLKKLYFVDQLMIFVSSLKPSVNGDRKLKPYLRPYREVLFK